MDHDHEPRIETQVVIAHRDGVAIPGGTLLVDHSPDRRKVRDTIDSFVRRAHRDHGDCQITILRMTSSHPPTFHPGQPGSIDHAFVQSRLDRHRSHS